jgi:UDP-N-acetyl-D-galactosamine dehydrogenase
MLRFEDLKAGKETLAVVGLGYVGLPLAVALSRHFSVLGFDIAAKRVEDLRAGRDRTGSVGRAELASCAVEFSSDEKDLAKARLFLVAVPTPIDAHRTPDLRPIVGASRTVGANMPKGSVVVYESTVWPGLTEEVCVPLLAAASGLECGRDFFVGYSPERVNPGDAAHTLATIVKVVAGQTAEVAELLARVYGSVVSAGVFKARDIKTAEAAKVIENTQRDLNIALMNELAMIFDRMGIDTLEVLAAAQTKWNFLPFRPGLVGGHCIGVDPYYLTFKAEALGIHPQVILAGRKINDAVAKYVAEALVKELIRADSKVKGAKVGVLGLTFKENVPDLRNTKVADLVRELAEFGVEACIHDPLADPEEAREEHGIALHPLEDLRGLDALVLAVPHQAYARLSLSELKGWFADPTRAVLVDVKGHFNPRELDAAGFRWWRL